MNKANFLNIVAEFCKYVILVRNIMLINPVNVGRTFYLVELDLFISEILENINAALNEASQIFFTPSSISF